jgi:hypothetical protein
MDLNKINKGKLYNAYSVQRKHITSLKLQLSKLTSANENLKLENKKLRCLASRQKKTITSLKKVDLINQLTAKLGEKEYKKTCDESDVTLFKRRFTTRIINGNNYYVSLLEDTDTQFIYEILENVPMFTPPSIGKVLGWMENQTPNFN